MKTLSQMSRQVVDGLKRQRERVRRMGLDLDVRDDLTVWADGDPTGHVVALLRELGVEPAYLVQPEGAARWAGSPLPLIDERKLADEVAEKGPLTLFAGGSTGTSGPVDAFCRQLTALAASERLAGLPMRHAVSLVERVTYDPSRILVNGMPGAGNILLQRLVQLMQETYKQPVINQAETLLGMFAWDYREALFSPIHEMVLDRHPEADTHLRLTARDFVTRGWVWPRPDAAENPSGPAGVPRHRLLVSGFAAPTCMHTTFHATHEPMHAGVMDHYRRRGYRAIITLRHPLDVMVSIAAKSSMRPNGEREPERLLYDLDWFASACDAATAYYRGYAELGDEVLMVKYEELMAAPLVQLHRLAAWLGTDLGEEALEGMWGQVADKSLTGRPEHYWKPGAGKYLKLLNRSHVPIIAESGLADAVGAMGYEIDLDTLNGQAGPIALEPDYPAWHAKKQHYDIHYHQVIGKRRTTEDAGIFVAEVAAPAGGLDTFGGPGLRPGTTVVSHDGALFERVVEYLGSSAYAALRDGFEPRCKVGQEQNRAFVQRMTGR